MICDKQSHLKNLPISSPYKINALLKYLAGFLKIILFRHSLFNFKLNYFNLFFFNLVLLVKETKPNLKKELTGY